MTSRNVRYASVALWKASKTFFKATIYFVFLSIAFHTTPYAPLPIFYIISYFCIMCVSISSVILKKLTVKNNYEET